MKTFGASGMSRAGFKSGFSIVEIMTVVAIMLLLGGILLGIGNRIRSQANDRLAESTLDILVCAMEQYYATCEAFPFTAGDPYGEIDFEMTLDVYFQLPAGTTDVIAVSGSPGPDGWSSGALYYFLEQMPNSKSIIGAIDDSLKTTKDASGIPVTLDIDGDGVADIDFVRFVDPWGRSLRYTCLVGESFPKIVSAGADGIFNTDDDIRSRR